MIERHIANTSQSASFGQYDQGQDAGGAFYPGYGAYPQQQQQQQFGSFSPGELYAPAQNMPMPPPVAAAAPVNPIAPRSVAYATQAPANTDQQQPADGTYGNATSTPAATAAYLSRKPSAPLPPAAEASQAHYVDLSRGAGPPEEVRVQPLNVRSKRPDSGHTTVYDPEDAYGGI
jgi:hypothetical protein